MKKEIIEYKGKKITIEKINGVTILSTDKIFRRRPGTDQEVVDKLIAEAKEIIDIERR